MSRDTNHDVLLARRPVVRAAPLGGAVGVAGSLAACSGSSTRQSVKTDPTPTTDRPRCGTERPAVLLAFFSRPGENYYYGGRRDLAVGNTKVLARMIADLIPCDVYEIEAAEPYSANYDDTVRRNVREQESDARSAIAKPLPDVDTYDMVLVGSPIWNVRPPMIMRTFAESLDFTGKKVHPFTTYAISGLGTAEREYAEACRGANLGEGLAVQGEEVADAIQAVGTWLRRIGILLARGDVR